MTLEGLLQVSTKKGQYFVGSQQDVYVHAGFSKETGKDLTLRKKGGDLNIGDLVLLHAQSIDVPFHEVKKDLDELSPPYHRARHTVMTVVKEGKQEREIPQLRQLLLRGLTQVTDIPYDEQKALMHEGADYDTSDYARFVIALKDFLPDVPSSRLLNWLHGNVIAPRDWETFNQLCALDMRFGKIYDTMGKEDSFFARYKLYVGANQVVMRSLGGFADDSPTADDENGEQLPKTQTRKPSRNYEPQIRAIFERYGHLLDDKTLAMRVTNIKEVEQRKKGHQEKTPATVLSRGVVNKWTPNPEGITWEDLCFQNHIFGGCFLNGIEKYFLRLYPSMNMERAAFNIAAAKFISRKLFGPLELEIIRAAEQKYIKPGDIVMQNYCLPEYTLELQQTTSEFLRLFQGGSLDDTMQLPNGTWDSTVAAMQKTRALVPRSFYEVGILRSFRNVLSSDLATLHINRDERRDKESIHRKICGRIDRLDNYLLETYNIDKNLSLRRGVPLREIIMEGRQKGIFPSSVTYSYEDYLNAKKAAKSRGIKIITRDEAVKIFGDAGAPLAVNLLNDLNWI